MKFNTLQLLAPETVRAAKCERHSSFSLRLGGGVVKIIRPFVNPTLN